MPKPPANFTRLDPGRSDVGMLIGAMLRAREVIATKSWSTSQEPTSEHWWADVLADPRARIPNFVIHIKVRSGDIALVVRLRVEERIGFPRFPEH